MEVFDLINTKLTKNVALIYIFIVYMSNLKFMLAQNKCKIYLRYAWFLQTDLRCIFGSVRLLLVSSLSCIAFNIFHSHILYLYLYLNLYLHLYSIDTRIYLQCVRARRLNNPTLFTSFHFDVHEMIDVCFNSYYTYTLFL